MKLYISSHLSNLIFFSPVFCPTFCVFYIPAIAPVTDRSVLLPFCSLALSVSSRLFNHPPCAFDSPLSWQLLECQRYRSTYHSPLRHRRVQTPWPAAFLSSTQASFLPQKCDVWLRNRTVLSCCESCSVFEWTLGGVAVLHMRASIHEFWLRVFVSSSFVTSLITLESHGISQLF